MRGNHPAVLDACVIIPMPLVDTLLRFAEAPRLYRPLWTDQIMAEVTRNLVAKFRMTPEWARRREEQIRKAFPESWIDGYEPLIQLMDNDLKDRHVLAAAVKSNSELIITYNAKHFPTETLLPWGIEAQGPSTFLISLYELDPALAIHKLHGQADTIGMPFAVLLRKLFQAVPRFVKYICREQEIDFNEETASK